MAPIVYVLRVRGHPEYPVDNMVGESAESVAKTYTVVRNIPPEVWDDVIAYDCYTATMYHFHE